MFFVISKLAEILLTPSDAIAIVGLAGLLLAASGRRRAGAALTAVAAFLVLVIGWGPAGSALLLPLEDRFPAPDLPEHVAGIVYLGGAIDPIVSGAHDRAAIGEAAERLTATAELARRYPDARIVISGGIGRLLTEGSRPEAFWAARLLERLGVAAERIALDETSRNTIENAVNSRRIAEPKPSQTWLLVTSAFHMPRAVACFEKAGFPVVPYPVDYRARPADLWQPAELVAVGLSRTDTAVHEWLGLLGYHLLKGTVLFPGPERQR